MRALLTGCVSAGTVAGVAIYIVLTRLGAAGSYALTLALLAFALFLTPTVAAATYVRMMFRQISELAANARKLANLHGGVLPAEPQKDAVDDLRAALEVLSDLIARQSAAFTEQRIALDQITSALQEGVVAVSPAGRVVFANSQISTMFGTQMPLAGRSILEVVRKQRVTEAIEKALEGNAPEGRIVVTAGHDDRQIEMRVVSVPSSGGLGAVALFVDISDLARLQRIRRDFLDDFSHEVRTPLAGLRSAAETIEGGRLTAEQEEALRQVMLRQLNRIERLVKDLAELNRIESGELVLERRRVDLKSLLADLCHEFRGRTSETAINFSLTGEEVFAVADPVRLQQIFSNLLDNAWKHGGGGEVLIEVTRGGGYAVIRVSDSGEGIRPEEIDRIFNRFYRVDRSRSQAVPGVGLGLSITKHLVLLHQGTIRAFNREGGGATFEVRLPAA